MVWISEQLGGSTQQLFGHSACRRLLESFAHVGGWPFGVAVKCLAEQSFLVTECGIKTGAVDTHRLGQVR